MTPTLRQQIDLAVKVSEQDLETLKHHAQPDTHSIEGEEKELSILKTKQAVLVD